jgi:UDP-N-acetylglucosamine 4,6-dehydratase/5-epimerase
MFNMFKGKKILITGGTGSLGQALSKRLLDLDVDTIRIFSRNENKQVVMESEFNDSRLRFLIGDIRDQPRLIRAFEDVDIVFHAAALKHVPVVEYNPFESVKTNVLGSQNVIEACLQQNVEVAVAVGTDKAVSPLNTYGASKLLMEKLFVTAHNYLNHEKHKTKFIALRYGNVMGSSGSVIPKFINQIKNNQKNTITDPEMTRFNITMDDALDFILKSTTEAVGSEISIPKLKKYSILDLKDALQEILGKTGWEKVPIREGEKIHEVLINIDEKRSTWETDDRYIIINDEKQIKAIKDKNSDLKKAEFEHQYSSDSAERIPMEELKETLLKLGLIKTN